MNGEVLDAALLARPEWRTLSGTVSCVSRSNQSGVWNCWEWTGAKNEHGYAKMVRQGKTHRVHRYVYQLVAGELGPGINVCHACDNPPCIRPSHMFPGTQADNEKDKKNKGRRRDLRGEQAGRAILTEEQVNQILRDTRTEFELARIYQVNRSTISHIKTLRNWKHLQAGSNVLRRPKGVHATAKENCPHGHPYSGDNLVLSATGSKLCLTCRRTRGREYQRNRRKEMRFDPR